MHVYLIYFYPSLDTHYTISLKIFSFSLLTFAGNLPFTVTADDVREYFHRRGVPVVAVRMLTDRESGRSRGCCFVEFANDKCQQVSNSVV